MGKSCVGVDIVDVLVFVVVGEEESILPPISTFPAPAPTASCSASRFSLERLAKTSNLATRTLLTTYCPRAVIRPEVSAARGKVRLPPDPPSDLIGNRVGRAKSEMKMVSRSIFRRRDCKGGIIPNQPRSTTLHPQNERAATQLPFPTTPFSHNSLFPQHPSQPESRRAKPRHSRNTQLIPPPVKAPANPESNTLSFLTLDTDRAVFSS